MTTGGRPFCAAQSLANNERIYGTVARVNRWFLIEYPGAWHRDAIDGSLLASDLKATLARWQRSIPPGRALLIRQKHQLSGSCRCFLVRSTETAPSMRQLQIPAYHDLKRFAFDDMEADASSLDTPIYAVCTHGTHDKCCARYGLPVFAALRDAVGELAWQCSHVGGDRFAANLVCFPYGIYYGRVTPADVERIVEMNARGEISLAHYRGRCCHPRIVQAADYFVRAETGRAAIEEFRVVEATHGDDSARIRFAARSDNTVHEIELRRNHGKLTEYLTCTAEQPSPVAQYDLIRHTVEQP